MASSMPIEGDYIETFNGIIFAVKGFLHPPGFAVAYPKYYPRQHGDRFRHGKPYAKIESIAECYRFLREVEPSYLRFDPVFNETLPEVPLSHVAEYYSPRKFLEALVAREENLDWLEKVCLEMAKLLSEASGVPLKAFGVSGSTMLGLHRAGSDIDLVVYGFREGVKVYEALGRLRAEAGSPFKAYGEKEALELWRRRIADTDAPLNLFARLEAQRRLEGFFKGYEYFIRLLNPPSEKYGESSFRPLGRVEVEAVVADSSQSIFTPCIYRVEDVKPLSGSIPGEIHEVYTLRGRFCELAEAGAKIKVSGKLEEVLAGEKSYLRIVVGGSRSDIIIPIL